ncbi:F-box family protein [Rhynchospora pubera]|uniref:F-box family protein n=1 Tax=Rhynchospora pubera TaxID=906938 RepID=A0AAV8CVI7_9POAL|nr:F-box family protein [Rhynchospora pubera]
MDGSRPLPRTPDWSMLPPELLQTIARKLPDISDFVKFRAVCTTWRSSARVSDLPPQLPWFVEVKGAGYIIENFTSNIRFYSLFSGKIHTIPSPNSSGNWLRGPAHDYIVLYNKASRQISLLNPLTGRKVGLSCLDFVMPHPVWVGPDPIESGEPVVLCGKSADFETGFLALYQPAEREWVVIEEPCLCSSGCCYFNGMLFVKEMVTETRDTKVIDTVTRKVVHVVPPPREDDYECDAIMCRMYLVQSGGDILQVVMHYSELLEMADCHFHIHRLDLRSGNGGKPRWVKISSIGDQILFLDQYNGFSLSCRDFSGFRGNSIYFIKRHRDIHDQSLSLLCRYDIEEARAEPLNCPFVGDGTWIVPSLR